MFNRPILGIVLVASCIVGTAQAAEEPRGPSPAEVAKIKADVTAAANEYLAKFSREDAKSIGEQVYSHPSVAIRNGNVELVDQAKIAESYAGRLKNLKASGWAKSAFVNPKVCVLTSDIALMSSKYARYDKNNKVIMEGAETDVFTKTPQGWKLVSLFGHGADRGIDCKE